MICSPPAAESVVVAGEIVVAGESVVSALSVVTSDTTMKSVRIERYWVTAAAAARLGSYIYRFQLFCSCNDL